MNCNNCNYKKSYLMSAVREIKPGSSYIIFFNDEEYGWDTIEIYTKFLHEQLPDNTFIFMPASMIKEVTCN